MGAQIVTFTCILKNRAGRIISSSVSRDVLTSLPGVDAPLKGLACALQKLKKGERRRIHLSADEAYGFYDPKKTVLVPRKMIVGASSLRVGQSVKVLRKSGESGNYTVLEIHKHMVQLDGNHPLAGQDLDFEIEALDVREATAAEIDEAVNPVSAQVLH